MYFIIIIAALVIFIRVIARLSLENVVTDVIDNMINSDVVRNAISTNIGSYVSNGNNVSLNSVLSWLLKIKDK
jgi:hypothetical protein